jgi:hypothetical protein
MLTHGEVACNVTAKRFGFVVRYTPTQVRQTPTAADTALLVRGLDEHNHFEYERSPDGDYTPDVCAYHAQLAQRRKGVVLQRADAVPQGTSQTRWN